MVLTVKAIVESSSEDGTCCVVQMAPSAGDLPKNQVVLHVSASDLDALVGANPTIGTTRDITGAVPAPG